MLKLLRARANSILGIDISSSAVKILEISRSKEAFCVQGYGCDTLPPSALDGHWIKDTEAVANCIKKVLLKSRFTSKYAAIAIPDSVVINKIIPINDGLTEQEMEEFVLIEADKCLPYPIDEINIDFKILRHSVKNSSLLDVLIVASRADHVARRVEAATLAGLTVNIVDVESFAVERAVLQLIKELPFNRPFFQKIVAIIDIGTHFCHLFVLEDLKLIFSREEKFGGLQLTEAVAERYHMTLEKAAEFLEQEELPNDYNGEIVTPFNEKLLLQIKRSLQFFYSTGQHHSVDHILLAGGVAKQHGLDALIQDRLGITTSLANPLSGMSINTTISPELITREAPTLMVACGLALRTALASR